MRSRFFLGFGVLTLLFILSLQVLQQINMGVSTERFMINLGFGGILFFGSVISVFISVQTLYAEIENRTLIPLLTKPIGWTSVVLGKFLAMWAMLAVYVGVLGWILFGFVWWETGGQLGFGWTEFLYVLLAEWFFFGLLLAAGILFASYATSGLFAMMMLSIFWVLGHLQHMLAAVVRNEEPTVLEHILGAVQWFIPNFQVFHLSDLLTRGGVDILNVLMVLGVGSLFIGSYLLIARLFFSIREL